MNICQITLQSADMHRLMIYGAPLAFILTRTGANPPDNPGEGEVLSHLLGRFLIFALGD
jgi:hypothetical protein